MGRNGKSVIVFAEPGGGAGCILDRFSLEDIKCVGAEMDVVR